MKRYQILLAGLLTAVLFMFALPAFAQTNDVPGTNSVPVIGNVENDTLPTSKEDFWRWAIAIVVPAIVMGIKKVAPVVPNWMLPLSTPLLGLALGFGLKQLGLTNWGWVDMTQAGALAVFIREVWHEAVKARNASSSS